MTYPFRGHRWKDRLLTEMPMGLSSNLTNTSAPGAYALPIIARRSIKVVFLAAAMVIFAAGLLAALIWIEIPQVIGHTSPPLSVILRLSIVPILLATVFSCVAFSIRSGIWIWQLLSRRTLLLVDEAGVTDIRISTNKILWSHMEGCRPLEGKKGLAGVYIWLKTTPPAQSKLQRFYRLYWRTEKYRRVVVFTRFLNKSSSLIATTMLFLADENHVKAPPIASPSREILPQAQQGIISRPE